MRLARLLQRRHTAGHGLDLRCETLLGGAGLRNPVLFLGQPAGKGAEGLGDPDKGLGAACVSLVHALGQGVDGAGHRAQVEGR